MSDSATTGTEGLHGTATVEQKLWVTQVFGVAFAPVQPRARGDSSATDAADHLAKVRQVWVAARRKVESDVSKLQTAVVDAYADRGLGPKLAAAYQNEVAWVLNQLDERVMSALDDLVANGNERRHAALVGEAREAIGDYQTFVSTDRIIDGLDKNPFGVSLALRSTLNAALRALDKAIV